MRHQISLLVAATTSAIVVSLVVPMCLLVQALAADRATSAAQQQAQAVAAVVASATTSADITGAVGQITREPGFRTTVVMPDGQSLGGPAPSRQEAALVARAAQGEAFTDRSTGQVRVLVPIALDAGTAIVLTSVSAEAMRRGVTTAWSIIIALGLLLFVVSLVVARALAARIATPVTDLAVAAHRIRLGQVDTRVRPGGPAEVQEVGRAFNLLAARIHGLIAAERDAVADLSHRLRTPVTALRLDSEAVTDPEVGERLRQHVDQLQRTVDAVLRDARRPVRGELSGTCDARAVTVERVHFWEPLAAEQGRSLTVQAPPGPVPVALDEADLRDLLDNLLDNVFGHTPDGAVARVSLALDGGGAGGGDPAGVLLSVADDGPGFPDVRSAPERGHSGADSTGLGLDIVRRIARSSGGDIELGRSPLGGAEVRVRLGAPA